MLPWQNAQQGVLVVATVIHVRAGFSKRPSGVGVSLTNKGNTRRIMLEVL
jgi:hypothetical protein